MTQKKPNHLKDQHSPYLLQHALNPVDWYPWHPEALELAKSSNKLLVISIGYAACHWCHVMEHESFEDQEVAEVMNSRFISIKVDREEHPDVDLVYMPAAYVSSGRGGWPLNVIALPNQKPVFAGTYFTRHDWIYILNYFAEMHRNNPLQLLQMAGEIESGMLRHFRVPGILENEGRDIPSSEAVFDVMSRDFDTVRGGSLGAPKFPMPATLRFMINHGLLQRNPDALKNLEMTLLNMARGGIYDHLGGGFCRYSVDAEWHVPHFEKMLYDNAQLIQQYSIAYRYLGNPVYKKVVEECIDFADRELSSAEGLYYASLDADSEGKEGSYYTWTSGEILEILHEHSDLFQHYFSCTAQGNWENGLNVLKISDESDKISSQSGYSVNAFDSLIRHWRSELRSVRAKRPAPATDTKILTGWNALMISALVKAAEACSNSCWYQKAVNIAGFYHTMITSGNGKLWRNRTWTGFSIPAFLEDYCLLEKAFLDLYQTDLNTKWLQGAILLNEQVFLHFSDPGGIFFRVTSDEEFSLIQHPVELSDNVIPASNSVMAENLLILGYITGKTDLTRHAEKMVKVMAPQASSNPWFHANWAAIISLIESGPIQVCIAGNDFKNKFETLKTMQLHGIIWSGGDESAHNPEVERKRIKDKTIIYICVGKTCYAPVVETGEAIALIYSILETHEN